MPLSPSVEFDAIAKILDRYKPQICRCLFAPLARLEKCKADIDALGLDFVVRQECMPSADYLIRYLRSGAQIWRSLYLGHMLDQMRMSGDDVDSSLALRHEVLDAQRVSVVALLSTLAGNSNAERLDEALAQMHQPILRTRDDNRYIRILFVGDCLFESVVAFLRFPLLEQGITLQYEYVISKNPAELRDSLRRMGEKPFDLVCYSPYSTAHNPVLYQTWSYPNPLQRKRKFVKLAREAHQLTRATLRILCDMTDCTISVQNTANMQHENRGLLRGTYSLAKRTLSNKDPKRDRVAT